MTDLVQHITVWQNRKVTAMPEAPKEPTLRDLWILLQAVDQRLTVIENDLKQRFVAVKSSLEFACAKISSMEAEVSDLKKQLTESHRQVEKYRIQDKFRSKEYNLLFHGIEITKMPETQDLSDQLIRWFMTKKLQFTRSLVSNMKFANVHRLPKRTDPSKISNSTSKRPPPIVVKFCTMRDKMEVFKLAPRSRQFHCAITKYLPISMQRQRKSLLAHANMLFKAGKKIPWKVIDADYFLFADGEREMPEARSMPSRYNKSPDSNYNKGEACFNY